MGTKIRSILRKARLEAGYPLSTGKTSAKPPATSGSLSGVPFVGDAAARRRRPMIDPGTGASEQFTDRKKQTKALTEEQRQLKATGRGH